MAELKILVVDDEPGIRAGVKRILRDFKVDYPFMDEFFTFDVLEAPTGEDAIDIIINSKPDLVLLDNKLPGIQGIEVLEFISKEKLEMVVVMITSYASLELAVKATKDGAHDFIPKPFTPQELKSSIENITKHIFLKRMTNKLQEDAKQIRFQFMQVLSHELKAPLNAIDGYLKMIKERQLGETLEDYNDIIEKTLKRVDSMRTLILDLLDFTKAKSEKRIKAIDTINLKNIAQIACDTFQPYAIQKNVKISLEAEDDIFIQADANDMEIILNNLVSNAVKYNKTDGEVFINIHKSEENIIIDVKDTGIGMSAEEKAKIFDDFVRIKNEKTKNITGSGLGLPILKNLVESYNGSIRIISTPDVGTTFILKFPVTNL